MPNNAQYLFWDSRKLRKILGPISMASVSNVAHMFEGCSALTNVHLQYLRQNLDLSSCPKLDLDTFQYMLIDPRNNSTNIAVTVHPDVYAKITNDTNTEWHALLAAAEAKNITFVTP